jgi:hypothetical protein
MNITFNDHDNFLAFQNMAENLWLNYRDDNQEPEFGIVDRLIQELNLQWTKTIDATTPDQYQYPMTLTISDVLSEMAQSVLENAIEYSVDADEEDDAPLIHQGEVTIA